MITNAAMSATDVGLLAHTPAGLGVGGAVGYPDSVLGPSTAVVAADESAAVDRFSLLSLSLPFDAAVVVAGAPVLGPLADIAEESLEASATPVDAGVSHGRTVGSAAGVPTWEVGTASGGV